MVFVKVIRNKSYFRRFHIKFRRRRHGSGDQDGRIYSLGCQREKYQTPKHRLIVRFTNKDICAQIALSKLEGDTILTAAYSHELSRYGVSVGLTNYAAGYCTGLLLARRVLNKLGLENIYEGRLEADGEMFCEVDRGSGPGPLKAGVDIGTVRATTGAKVFAVVKGALDGGVVLPYSKSWFPGYDSDLGSFDPSVLRDHILGAHIASYMLKLQREDERIYHTQFSQYVKNDISPDRVEEMYRLCHAAIRADPSPKSKVHKKKEEKKEKKMEEKEREKSERKSGRRNRNRERRHGLKGGGLGSDALGRGVMDWDVSKQTPKKRNP